jgi:hypothetical protein
MRTLERPRGFVAEPIDVKQKKWIPRSGYAGLTVGTCGHFLELAVFIRRIHQLSSDSFAGARIHRLQ